MDEKKIVFKSIDEQLAEDERREAAKAAASRKSPERAVEKAATGTKTATGPKRGRKKLRLKKSVRRTIGSLMLATSIVVAAVPVGGVSADSSGTYRGSTAKAPEIDTIVSDTTAPVNRSGSGQLGGFPLIEEKDGSGNYVKREIGGNMYYVVDTNGYASNELVRPIYALSSSKSNIEAYFETNGTDDVYIPPSGKLNLFTGYVNDTTTATDWTSLDKSKWWEYDGRLYVPQVKKFELSKKINGTDVEFKPLYGKRIQIFDKVSVITHNVTFYDEDGDPCGFRTVRHGDVVTDIPAFPPSTHGGTNPYWSPKPQDTPITADNMEFHVKYTYPSPKAGALGPEEDSELSVIINEDGSETGTTEVNPDGENNPDGEDNPDGENNPDSTVESGTEDSSELTDSSAVETGSSPVITTEESSGATNNSGEEVIEENHEIENAESGGIGLTGILLQWYPDNTGTEYKDDPTETIYVCDDYAAIANICDDAFADTTNVSTVDLPSNILKIGDRSFKGSNVSSITLGSGLNSIGASAFENCLNLTTASYGDEMALNTIGSKAFANSSLSNMSNGGSGVSIPYTVKTIGNAAFYGTKMSTLDVSRINGCAVNDYAFARCNSLTKVELDYYDGTMLTINTLDSKTGLFCQCEALTEANMPKQFNGTLTAGMFGSCTAFNHIIFNSVKGTFTDGEFDYYQITVEGPKPNSLEPATSGVASYVSAMKVVDTYNNDYVYRYIDTDNHQHEIATEYGYTHSDEFFKDKTAAKAKTFIFDVDETDGYVISDYYSSTAGVDLEIGNNIGRRNDGDIPVNAIGEEVFKDDNTIKYLQLNANLDNIYKSAFDNTKIVKLWAYVDGTEFHDSAFANNGEMTNATFAYGGEGGSKIDSKCFAETPKLNNIDFYDDNLTDGNKNLYARFFAGSIAGDAFYTTARTTEITFKGPMVEGYAPWEFAIDPNSKICPNQVFTKYYSGNPWNLTAQYVEEAFTKINGKNPWNPNAKEDKNDKYENYSGVCLLNYPNMSSKMDTDDIESASGTVTVNNLEAKTASSRTTMEQDCITYTRNIIIPYGVDFIDVAKTKRNDYLDGSEYFVFDDSTDLYNKNGKEIVYKVNKDETIKESYNIGGEYYGLFMYNPDVYTITFAAGGVSEFPDRMFEGMRNLETVTFAGNVTKLGELPFYMPDTEAYKTKYNKYEPDSFPHLGPGNAEDEDFRSHLEGVYFTGEGDTASAADEKYYSTTDTYGASTGIIKGDNGNRVKVVQIVPSRGDTCGAESITAEELSDVDEYADYAARDCDAIKTIVFPEDGCGISYGCFMDCDRLKNVTMPNQFFSVADQAFAGISTNMDVTFPYNNVNLNELPFDPASKDGLTMPDVTFHVHRDAEYLMDYADKNDNINYETIADSITLTYRDRYDDTYFKQVPAMANGYTFGYSYPPSPLPTYQGEEPSNWTGVDKNGNTVDWKTDPLTADTTFTSVYSIGEKVTITFEYDDGEFLDEVQIGKNVEFTSDMMPAYPQTYKGRTFSYISNNPVGKSFTETPSRPTVIHYEGSSSSSSSSTSTTSTTSPTTSSSSTSKSSSSSSSSKSSSSSSSGSSSSSAAYPVYVNSQDGYAGGSGMPITGEGSTVYVDDGSSGGGSGSGSGNGKKGSGNASVISTTGGISDTGKISATVNGSSDNYVIKITQTQEADEMGVAALHNEYGEDISPIRYLPFDISLYDSTGTNKISPVPEGVSVSLTMPIPDDLAIYGGNAKIASTAGGVLDKMTPRFTVINGVPCMTYTCTHFSPYMVYVDTAHLTEAGIADMTPKTADGIHPKWFLCFGLAAIAVVMFLKKDPEEYLRKAA